MKRVITITVSLLMMVAITGCSKAVADEKTEEPQAFEKVSDSAQFVPSEKPTVAPESEPEPVSDEVSEEEDEVYQEGDNYALEEASDDSWREGYAYYDSDYELDYESGYAYDPAYGENGPTRDMPGWHDKRKETYYSSNVLPHYRMGEWSVDDEGFYRTEEGYYVVGVGVGEYEVGDTFEGGKGTCVVMDFGYTQGVTDYYTNW